MSNPIGLGCLEEFKERALQHIRSEDLEDADRSAAYEIRPHRGAIPHWEDEQAPVELSKQILCDTWRLNPRGGLQPVVAVWTFMQGLNQAARHDLEARDFRVIDFTKANLFMEMKQALTPLARR